MGERERVREREREAERQRDTETQRHRDTETKRPLGRGCPTDLHHVALAAHARSPSPVCLTPTRKEHIKNTQRTHKIQENVENDQRRTSLSVTYKDLQLENPRTKLSEDSLGTIAVGRVKDRAL